MDKQIRRIGVLTSGGDAPGMNALIRSVVRSASANDISVLGIRRGYSGLINGDIIEMGARSVDGIIRKGGTMLYTARCKEMLTEEGLQKAADTCRYLGIDGLICCGGDGTFRGAQDVADQIHEATGIDTRVTILGHIQRGGSPSAMDRVMATRMGYAAVRALMEGKTNRVVVSDNNIVTDIDIEEGLAQSKDLNQCLFEAQQTVAI